MASLGAGFPEEIWSATLAVTREAFAAIGGAATAGGAVAWRLDGEPVFALEGSIFVAGAAVQWLRDGLGVIETAAQTEALAADLPDSGGVCLVPAFTGLGSRSAADSCGPGRARWRAPWNIGGDAPPWASIPPRRRVRNERS